MTIEQAYKILNVSQDASDEEIRKAYHKQSRATHPDSNPNDPLAQIKFQTVNEAMETIKKDRENKTNSFGNASYKNSYKSSYHSSYNKSNNSSSTNNQNQSSYQNSYSYDETRNKKKNPHSAWGANFASERTEIKNKLYDIYSYLRKNNYYKLKTNSEYIEIASKCAYGVLLRHALECILHDYAKRINVSSEKRTSDDLLDYIKENYPLDEFTKDCFYEAKRISNELVHITHFSNSEITFNSCQKFYNDGFKDYTDGFKKVLESHLFSDKAKRKPYLLKIYRELEQFNIKNRITKTLLLGNLMRQLLECTIDFWLYNENLEPIEKEKLEAKLARLEHQITPRSRYSKSTHHNLHAIRMATNQVVHVSDANNKINISKVRSNLLAQTDILDIELELPAGKQNTKKHSNQPNPYLTLLLCFFGGSLGLHRFYVGDTTWGLVYLFTGGLFGIGILVDLYKIVQGEFKLKNGKYIRSTWLANIPLGVWLLTFAIIGVIGMGVSSVISDAMSGIFSSDTIFPSISHDKDIVVDDLYQLKSNDNGYTITLVEDAHDRLPQNVTLPSEYEGKPITEIAENGFANCTNITSVIVPDSITTIGKGAFKGCNNLQSITLPFVGQSEDAKNEKAVLGYIFGYEAIETEASGKNNDGFWNNKPADIVGETWQYTWYDDRGYSTHHRTDYFYYIPQTLTTVTIISQNMIPTAAFNGCKNLTTIQYPNSFKSITSIGESAFQGCESLLFDGESKSILEFGNNITSIPAYAFNGCVNITEVIVPNTITSIGFAAFKNCIKIKCLTIPFVGESENAKNEKAVLGYIFGYEAIETEASGKDSDGFWNNKPTDIVGETWQYTWYNDRGYSTHHRTDYYYFIPQALTTVTVTNQKVIPTAAFNGCSNLTEIKYLSNKDETFDIGEAAFQNCTKLKFDGNNFGKLEISDNVLNIGDCAFAGCVNITEVIVSQTVRSVGKAAFMNCKNIESVELPFIGKSENASQHEAVLGYIFGYEAIDTETSGKSGDGFWNNAPIDIVGETWQYTWYNDRGYSTHHRTDYYYYIPQTLTTVTITNQNAIPTAAFNGCSNLTEIKYLSNKNETFDIGEAAFQNCTNLRFNGDNGGKLEISDKVLNIGDCAFAGCLNITEVIVPQTVRSIGKAAFMNCKKLQSIEIPFIGKSEGSSQYEAVLGYIFGYEAIETEASGKSGDGFWNNKPVDIMGKTWQYTWYDDRGYSTHHRTDYYYSIPESLSKVTITKQKNIPLVAFNGCKNLKTITILADSTIGDYAFQDCNAKIIEK